MRILQVANGFPPVDRGGVETYTLALSKALCTQGHSVVIFCREAGADRPIYDVRDEVVEGLPVRFVVNRFDGATPLAARYFDRQFEALFLRWVEEQQPDAIHFQHTQGLSASLLGCAAEIGLPFVVTLHDYWYMCPQVNLLRPDNNICPGSHHEVNCYECVFGSLYPPRGSHVPSFDSTAPEAPPKPAEHRPFGLGDGIYYPLRKVLPWSARRRLLNTYDFLRLKVWPHLRQLYWYVNKPDMTPLRVRARYMREILDLCDHIIVPSDVVKARYVDFGVSAERINVIPHGMDLSVWEGFRPNPRPHGHVFRFGYIGSLMRHKGVDFMIHAFQRLNSPDSELWIHGFELLNVPFTKMLHNLADGDPRIHFAGPYQTSELPGILSQLDVLLIPSIWHETYSIVTREAVLAGLPVIASRMGGIVDAVDDGVNGLLLSPGDMSAWVGAMRRVVDDPEMVARFHRAQLNRRVKSMASHAAELIRFYAQVKAEPSV